jgi:hypothetical protein
MGTFNWSAIATQIPGRNGRQCRERWNNSLNPIISKQPWSDDEDAMLLQRYDQFGTRWHVIATYFNGRTKNEVRNRIHRLQRMKVLSRPDEVACPAVEQKTDNKDKSESGEISTNWEPGLNNDPLFWDL